MKCPCCHGPVVYYINGCGEQRVACAHYEALGMQSGVCAWRSPLPPDLLRTIEEAARAAVERYRDLPLKRCGGSDRAGHPAGAGGTR